MFFIYTIFTTENNQYTVNDSLSTQFRLSSHVRISGHSISCKSGHLLGHYKENTFLSKDPSAHLQTFDLKYAPRAFGLW